jgi:GT2 family glycosyltransferase
MTDTPQSPADVSVLIVNWNTRDLVLGCLDALPVGIDDDLTLDVIVVDNGSTDGSVAALETRSGIVLVRNDSNVGFARAVNQAYAHSRAELVLLLNSDVELMPGALSVLVRFLRQHQDAAGAAPLYRYPDGTEQPFHFRFPSFTMTLANGSATIRRLLPGMDGRLRSYKMLDDDFSQARTVPQPSASCLLLRRDCLPDDHLMDERYPIFFNDVQFARRLANEGRSLWVVPDAVVVHEAHATTKKLGNATAKRQYIASVVQMLSETESPLKVWAYRSVVLVQNTPLTVLRRPGSLSFRNLLRALAGDPGPLPRQTR